MCYKDIKWHGSAPHPQAKRLYLSESRIFTDEADGRGLWEIV
ncbi:MAG: hypothetical protein OXN25_24730 [Candidatus Poribacteria bacterium]|nr:hypothetical protein [Candidatus Poribacteria bacterium]MDE0428073.1 hypothetical protein [Candidatus Poribacteria bacterium]